jgi:membrane protease YdiL (CAAX protease family)
LSAKRHPRIADVAAGVIVYLALHFALEVGLPGRFVDANRHPEGFLLAAAIDGLLMASVPLFFILRSYSEPPSAFGFSARRFPLMGLLGAAAGIALSAGGFAYGQILGWLGSYSENPYIGLFREPSSAALRVSMVLVVVVVAPIAEEVFFRAFVFSVVRLVSSIKLALGISSTLFALAHFNTEWFVLNCLFGTVLAVLLQRTGSLTTPIAAHMVLNAVGLASGVFFGEDVEELS